MEDLVESFSGVRGIFGKSITEKLAMEYAKAYCSFLFEKIKHAPRIVIGCDTRPSSGRLGKAMTKAASEYCSGIIDVGVSTTPMIELAVREYALDGGIIITASHNEPEFNGWKFLGADSAVLKPGEMQKVIDYRKTGKGNKAIGQKCIITEKGAELHSAYRKFVLSMLSREAQEKLRAAKLRVILDPNGGAAWKIAEEVMTDLGVQCIVLGKEPGKFHRKIEPSPQSLKEIPRKLKEENAVLGIAFDCDADRAEYVIPYGEIMGNILSGHYLIGILADSILPKLQKEKRIIVVNDATSQLAYDVVQKHKGKIYAVEVGETNVVQEMDKRNAALGGEGTSSGAIIPPARCRDGILASVLLLSIMSDTGKSVLELASGLPKYYTAQIKVKTDAGNIKKQVKKFFKGCKIEETGDETGGIKAWHDRKSWVWFRQSKTEPGIVRIIADSESEEKSNELVDLGKKALGININYC